MDALRDWFEKTFRIPFSTLVLPGAPLTKVDDLMWASPAAAKPLLVQGACLGFPQEAPDGYFLVGFWGHGINSYAFYYQRADGWSHVCFRLAYGGVYMDNELEARRIAAFFTAYFAFEKGLGRDYRLTAIDAMSEGLYELVHPTGRIAKIEESLEGNPNFSRLLS